MKRYLIVIEKTETGYSAYSPDLPGCVSTGGTRDEVESNMREAIEFHLDGMALVSPREQEVQGAASQAVLTFESAATIGDALKKGH